MKIAVIGDTSNLARTRIIPTLKNIQRRRGDVDIILWNRSSRVRLEHMNADIYYLAIPSSAYQEVINSIYNPKKVIFEKPFGKDFAEFEELSALPLSEKSIYRIDHYMAKSIMSDAQRINDLLLSDPLSINNIHIKVWDTDSGKDRPYFVEYGIVRDMIQTHLFCVLRKVIGKENVKHLRVQDYKEMTSKDFPSSVPTWAFIRLHMNVSGLEHIQIYLDAGKSMPMNKHTISVNDVVYSDNYKSNPYETLIEDCIRGDQSKFLSLEEVRESFDVFRDLPM